MAPPLSITGPWREGVERAGSVAQLARALAVPVSTLQHWIRGERTPSEIVQRAVNAWFARQRPALAPPFRLAA